MSSNPEKIVVAMSGGVDSSAACALLCQAGYQVTGVTLLLKGDIDSESKRSIDDAVEKLGINHHYIDLRQQFSDRVITPSAIEYNNGKTPNPCCLCNPAMKFAEIINFADLHGINRIATGHYASVKSDEKEYFLERGTDIAKDQSYFLYRLPGAWLKRLHFPLANLTKQDIRKIASDFKLEVHDRPDSQDVCFAVENECCGETLRRLAGLEIKKGVFTYNGRTVAPHRGIHLYTVGQRKGLGVALGTPAYIKNIDPVSGNIELVTEPELLDTESFSITDTVWNSATAPEEIQNITVKIRYRTKDTPCIIKRCRDTWHVTAQSGTFHAVTPGQSAVFYCGSRLLGGGIIMEQKKCC